MIKILLFLALSASSTLAGNFFSYVVKPTDGSVRIMVQNRRTLRLLTFTAEGPADCTQEGFIQSCTGPTIKAQIGGQPAVTIVSGTSLPVGQDFYVTGPAVVTVTTNATQTLFLTVFKEEN
jgi:hypothetical protein